MSMADDNGHPLGGDDAVAAEYVLGVLDAGERQAAARRIEAEPDFARLVDAWEVRLAPMAAAYPSEPAPDGAKQAIDRRLFGGQAVSGAAAAPGLWQSLAFWRGLTVAALAALALAIAVPLMTPAPEGPRERLVASLAPQEQSNVHYFVVYDASTRDIGLSHVTGDRASGRDFELWVIEGSNAPQSVGVIPAGSSVHLAVDDELQRKIAAGAALAISLEPAGGSPTGAPTGPVVALGELHDV